ncbi:MAG: L-glutamate gamma-semialdehyde dehydrogenase, partial [Caulobacterales bacterium]
LLRVPDRDTADKLIAETIASGNWSKHLGRADSWLVNASTWGLMIAGRMIKTPEAGGRVMARLVARAGEPIVRAAALQAMKLLGEQFVLGRTIHEALARGRGLIKRGEASTFSFDMLGEGARTAADAARYAQRYAEAIDAIVAGANLAGPEDGPGVSIKLSALHPRYDARHEDEVFAELYPVLLDLARRARAGDISFCLDAEEADRLILSLKLLDRLTAEPDLLHWGGLGLAVQAYQKRARAVIADVAELARNRDMRLMVRLVKGAYWDGEIKRAQVAGRPDYSVFTTKAGTDASYLACARDLLAAAPALYPQFATHNAHTAIAVKALAAEAGVREFEFQRLHGMGEALYAGQDAGDEKPVRVYAPVGQHDDLLPYLVRRLLENGANASFVHGFLDDDVSPDIVACDPLAKLEAGPMRGPRIPIPPKIFDGRENSSGRDLSITAERSALERARADTLRFSAGDEGDVIGVALSAQIDWNARGPKARGDILRAMADALQANADPLTALLAHEAKRTLQDGVDEVREAIDFCRYYGAEAERLMPLQPLPSPVGEDNALELMGRGVFVCISPWNFPLSIFTGQIAAALAAGNCVIAKPAEQTPRIAQAAIQLFREAGLPPQVLRLALGDGAVGAKLTADPRIAGVAFTGSTETARAINRTLAAHEGPLPVLIAETGGLNGMFVDTTALKEQVVDDVIVSAFGSAGQRCSSLRVLFLPHDTADGILETLKGALEAQIIGDPANPRTDIGPIIDGEAKAGLEAHLARMRKAGRTVTQIDVANLGGNFFGPAIVELDNLDLLEREVFGPILHVVRYDPDAVQTIGAQLAVKGYGLTLGVHSRLDSFAEAVIHAVPAGNVYVNRSIIGAVVGVQPFGGLGLSGTGPKAGGPHYIPRFCVERVRTINTTAQGGDPRLLSL